MKTSIFIASGDAEDGDSADPVRAELDAYLVRGSATSASRPYFSIADSTSSTVATPANVSSESTVTTMCSASIPELAINEQFGYTYDTAGNLNVRTNNTLTQTFAVNSINELTNATRAGTLTAAGNTAQTATSVSVNGQGAATYGDNTFATTAGLSLANGANTFTTLVQYASQTFTNITTSQLPTPVAFLYDANGNLTNDGLRSLSYDDENQLIAPVSAVW